MSVQMIDQPKCRQLLAMNRQEQKTHRNLSQSEKSRVNGTDIISRVYLVLVI